MNRYREDKDKAGIIKDPELARACELQAKWNGTTFQEEWDAMHRKKFRDNQFESKDGAAKLQNEQTITSVLMREVQSSGTLLKTERAACKYWNEHIRHNMHPCSGNVCGFDCPNVVCRRML